MLVNTAQTYMLPILEGKPEGGGWGSLSLTELLLGSMIAGAPSTSGTGGREMRKPLSPVTGSEAVSLLSA